MTSRQATIALLPGDGVGPEVVRAGKAVLETVAREFGHDFAFRESLVGGAAIDATGQPLPPETLAACRSADAVLLGAVGGPRWDMSPARPEKGLLDLRGGLGLFANLRPIQVWPEAAHASPLKPDRLRDVDFVVVRELTGGIYFGEKTLTGSNGNQRATDLCVYTTEEIARVTRVAAALAVTRRGRLTSVDKANVLETSRLWRRVVSEVIAAEFPTVRLDHLLVDACAMELIRRPATFDVILTENMFGDILTDEAAVLAGSIGLLPSASLGAGAGTRPVPGLYEPIHGSAPDLAGKNVANPIGTILSAALLLRYSLGLEPEAALVEHAARAAVAEGVVTPDIRADGGAAHSTEEVTRYVVRFVGERARASRPGASGTAAAAAPSAPSLPPTR